MTGKANTISVENPYVYCGTAQEYEQAGDAKGAEIGYKAAVLAADNLPLAEYRRNFQDELSKHMSVPGYRTPPDIGPEELKTAYAELLTLPLSARVKLAAFFSRQNQQQEALTMCNAAANLKTDDWILSQKLYVELRQTLDLITRTANSPLQQRRPASAPQTRQSSSGLHIVGKKEKQSPPSYTSLPDITELWNAHINALEAQQLKDKDSPPTDKDAPLTMTTKELVESMHSCLKRFVDDLSVEERKRLTVSITAPDSNAKFYRFRACTGVYTLSVRGQDDLVELFVVPTREVIQINEAETEHCLHARFKKRSVSGEAIWTFERYPLYQDEMRVTLRKTFKDLLKQCDDFLDNGKDQNKFKETHPLVKQLSELSEQRMNLAEKIVYQQEMVQNRIARDIHDSVIADLLALKRAYEAQTTQPKQVVNSLEEVCQRLRNICSDLAPRDLKDWGLRTVVTDLVNTASKRLQIPGSANISKELPELPDQVSLHIYRIIQECINNMEKHAKATEFQVDLVVDGGMFLITIKDNGQGFDLAQKDNRKAAQGGMGLDSIRERVELIRCFYPGDLWIQTQPGAGTKTVLQINVGSGTKTQGEIT